MDDLVRNLRSPAWWFTTIVAALIVNIVAAYAKPALDSILSRWSDGRKDALDQQRFEEKVSRLLRGGPTGVIVAAIFAADKRITSFQEYIISGLILGGAGLLAKLSAGDKALFPPTVMLFIASALWSNVAWRSNRHSRDQFKLVREARRRLQNRSELAKGESAVGMLEDLL